MARPEKPDEAHVGDDGTLKVPANSDIGTTHDPNSVTTGTDVEPNDRRPPKAPDK